jgi:CelD/BcsL family acetyltransferase involved in cellulose biosynthesis
LLAIAPFYIRRSAFGPWGPRALCYLAHKWVGSDHLNVIVDPEYDELGVEAIVRFVGQQRAEWDYVELADGEETSPTFARLCQGFKSLGMTERVTDSEVCPYTTLPSSFEEYLAGVGKNLRYNFRRRWRALEREGQVKFIVLRSGTELQESFGKLVWLHRLRFQQQDKYSSFLAPHIQEFHADSLTHIAAAGMARLFLLQIGDKAVAALYGFSVNKTFSFYQIGMDPAWSHLSVGVVMMGCSIEEAIRSGHDEFDFLRGDEAYKFQWARETRHEVTRYLFDRRIRSQWGWPEVWVKKELTKLIRGCLGMMEGLLPYKTMEHLVNGVRKIRERSPST